MSEPEPGPAASGHGSPGGGHAYTARVLWSRGEQAFLDGAYSRRYLVTFDGGAVVRGSASPHVVKVPLSDPTAVDPEEAFVSALASCHMLWFLSIAAGRGFRVDAYSDAAEGVMGHNAEGKLAMTVVTLHPDVTFSGERRPTREEILALHHAAHEACFLANSVRTRVEVEPRRLAGA